MSNQEAVDCIKNMKDAKAAAKHLSEVAISRKSKDDISCIVVKFQWKQVPFASKDWAVQIIFGNEKALLCWIC